MPNYFAGIDVGAVTTKCVIIDDRKAILGFFVKNSGIDLKEAAENCYQKAIETAKLSIENIKYVVGTGYGRESISFANSTKTEISCHAKGSYFYFPRAITVIDIGGQDTKVIKVDEKGRIAGFKMNRKCAAGTGAFLEEIAGKMKVPVSSLDELARKATSNIELSSYCTVFASTEILSKIRAGNTKEDMIRGAFNSVIKRVLEMDPLTGFVVMTGGVVAYNKIIVELIEGSKGIRINLPPNPQITGAFGAALFAVEEYSICRR
ncbi:MAG: acyl-CoA dehydratase activase [Candidatus Thermoplasmatota archaeon]|nr:acyl-CoA dehydratase activase [Candidatus Thermoplasmatota archaeon]